MDVLTWPQNNIFPIDKIINRNMLRNKILFLLFLMVLLFFITLEFMVIAIGRKLQGPR